MLPDLKVVLAGVLAVLVGVVGAFVWLAAARTPHGLSPRVSLRDQRLSLTLVDTRLAKQHASSMPRGEELVRLASARIDPFDVQAHEPIRDDAPPSSPIPAIAGDTLARAAVKAAVAVAATLPVLTHEIEDPAPSAPARLAAVVAAMAPMVSEPAGPVVAQETDDPLETDAAESASAAAFNAAALVAPALPPPRPAAKRVVKPRAPAKASRSARPPVVTRVARPARRKPKPVRPPAPKPPTAAATSAASPFGLFR